MKKQNNIENKKFQRWSNEEKEYLREIAKGNTYEKIWELMNGKFERSFSMKQIETAMYKYKLKNGVKKGFKKGNIPSITRDLGSERVGPNGCIEVKVAEPNKWKMKHRLIYEKYNGEIPKDSAVIFADGDKRNFDINNLILVSRQQLLVLNQNKLIQDNTDLTKCGVNIANLIIKLREVKNGV